MLSHLVMQFPRATRKRACRGDTADEHPNLLANFQLINVAGMEHLLDKAA
jgi:hypothetical protein